MFTLTQKEFQTLRSQIVTSNRGGTRYLPSAFTEQGVAMLSSILNSEKAIDVNIAIIRKFVLVKQSVLDYKDLSENLKKLEKNIYCVKLFNHKKAGKRNFTKYKTH